MAARSAQPKDDFNPNDLIQNVTDQGKNIDTLSEKVKQLEDKFGTHEKIADTLFETAEKQVKMKTLLADNFVKLLNEDDRVKAKISEAVKNTDRDYKIIFFRRFGLATWTIIVWIGGILTNKLAEIIINRISN